MNNWAPRCRDARSVMSVPAGWRLPSSSANSGIDTARPSTSVASDRRTRIFLDPAGWKEVDGRTDVLVMHRHPLRHRLRLVDPGPDRHRDEEHEVEERQHSTHVG